MLNYKGYTGHVEFDDGAGIFHGEVLDLRDVVTFQGKSVDELYQAFFKPNQLHQFQRYRVGLKPQTSPEG